MSEIEEMYARKILHDLLKDQLRPIVADLNLSKEQRWDKLFPLLTALHSEGLSFDEACSIWINAMAELVVELGLARH